MTTTRGWKKDSDRAVTPVAEAVRVPEHFALPGSPQAKQLRHLHAQFSLGQSPSQAKNNLVSVHAGSLQSCPALCDPVDWPARRVLQARILECIGQYWLPSPSRALFPAALAANSPEYLALPEPLRPTQLHHLHTWPSQGQTQVLQRSLRSKPHDPHAEVEIKPQLKPRGSVAKEEDPKPFQ